jgi:peroxiredoxin Q/BCP
VGTLAPTFVLQDQDGNSVPLADQRGRWVVLYFYPEDDTPGCTTQACDFRDSWHALRSAGVAVLGVSPDDAASHRKFRDKYQLPFPLLVDEGHRVAERY